MFHSECQLRFIKNVLDGVASFMIRQNPVSLNCRFFWLDTFAVPVANKAKPEHAPVDLFDLRRQSISHMYDVYDQSSHSLVLDDDLCSWEDTSSKGNDLIAAMKLITSMWMRRLWTLQEAFLSKEMCFPGRTEDGKLQIGEDQYPGRGFDSLIQRLGPGQGPRRPTILKVSLAEVLERHLFENLMGRGRKVRIETGIPIDGEGSQLIASAWRSARWRVSGCITSTRCCRC